MFGRRKSLIFLLLIFSTFLCSSILRAERWSRKSINSLPDFAFASVEYRSDGQKVRHLPQHDHTGKLDLPHLWSALARINQGKWVDSKNEAGPWLHLEANVREYKRELSEHGQVRFPIDINEAPVEELIKLPHIGETRAGAIVDYRIRRGPFRSIEEVTKVRGISLKIFQEIPGYISVQ